MKFLLKLATLMLCVISLNASQNTRVVQTNKPKRIVRRVVERRPVYERRYVSYPRYAPYVAYGNPYYGYGYPYGGFYGGFGYGYPSYGYYGGYYGRPGIGFGFGFGL